MSWHWKKYMEIGRKPIAYLQPSYVVQSEHWPREPRTCLVHKVDRSFLMLFWVFGPCIRSYQNHLRRIICVGDTYLTGNTLVLFLSHVYVTHKNMSFPLRISLLSRRIRKAGRGSFSRCITLSPTWTATWLLSPIEEKVLLKLCHSYYRMRITIIAFDT